MQKAVDPSFELDFERILVYFEESTKLSQELFWQQLGTNIKHKLCSFMTLNEGRDLHFANQEKNLFIIISGLAVVVSEDIPQSISDTICNFSCNLDNSRPGYK